MSPEIIVPTIVHGEVQILDIDLGKRLGFKRPRKIRDLIKRYAVALDRLGFRATMGRVINGGEILEFYLNRKQVIFVAAKAETATATASPSRSSSG
jgi:DNA polymerase